RRRLPLHHSDAVEAKETVLRAEPQVSVRRLTDGGNAIADEAVANLPGRVRVLTEVRRRIQGERPGTRRQQQADLPHRQANQRPPEGSGARAHRKGIITLIVVPRPGAVWTSNVPPSWPVRSRIVTSPSPPARSNRARSNPTPSSATVRDTAPFDRISRTAI